MKYLRATPFTVGLSSSKYSAGWDRIFGPKEEPAPEPEPAPEEPEATWPPKGRRCPFAPADARTVLGTMPLDRAETLTRACVANAFARHLGTKPVPALPDVSLEELLIANRLVIELAHSAAVDPRGVAAAYALKEYQGDVHDLLAALGYRLEPPRAKRKR